MAFSLLLFLHMANNHELLYTYISHIQSSLFQALNIIHFTCINVLSCQHALEENIQQYGGHELKNGARKLLHC